MFAEVVSERTSCSPSSWLQRSAQQSLAQLITREYGDTQLEALAFAACARYDARNQHGRSQGAVLDRTIT